MIENAVTSVAVPDVEDTAQKCAFLYILFMHNFVMPFLVYKNI